MVAATKTDEDIVDEVSPSLRVCPWSCLCFGRAFSFMLINVRLTAVCYC